ncbi:GNAT family N-acetyltransferase [Streptomyces sp. IB201691-2A2]|uniref:GNAT family N-acetyltransferase n=1 Tax=Streptomyces sp. IB201691-2A2 TaxID=2561920 RepID=UPI0011812A9C|nr:GNAT family N-acetyltransferase [Streptomyces sp. IB201691-2A2]TRO68385.1 GNAT family N-acetyltransferase [Streptomyces sp. IB201691-2A2]
MSDVVHIRHITEADWDGIVEIESRAYTGLGLSEGRAALRSRAEISPSTCFVLDIGSGPAGYLLALPYPALSYPDLERTEEAVVPPPPAPASRNLHLHDIVVEEGLRGRGLGQRLLHHFTLAARSRGYERISLIAVGRSDTFWSARGYTAHPGVSPGGYGANAVYMSKAVPADPGAQPEPTGVVPRGPSVPTKRADARVPCP